jgi:hypothetical protein
MGKVTIEFDSVDEQDDIRDALDGYKWKLTVYEIDQYLRNELKYNEKLSNLELKFAEKTREQIREILKDYSLNLD